MKIALFWELTTVFHEGFESRKAHAVHGSLECHFTH